MLFFSLSDVALLIILFRLPCSRLTIAGAAVSGEEGEERRKAEGNSGEGGELVADLPEVERLRIEVSRRSFSWRRILLSKIMRTAVVVAGGFCRAAVSFVVVPVVVVFIRYRWRQSPLAYVEPP